LRLDAGVADHLAETVDVRGEQLGELFRRARCDVDRLRRDLLHHLRRIRRLDEFLVQLAHDLGWRAGGRDDTLPNSQLGPHDTTAMSQWDYMSDAEVRILPPQPRSPVSAPSRIRDRSVSQHVRSRLFAYPGFGQPKRADG
jgi:hypothetical protein